MIKTDVKEIKTKINAHNVFCDSCGRKLGSYLEEEDGYWHNPHVRKHDIKLPGGDSMIYRADLCDDCEKRVMKQIKDDFVTMLKRIGYEES